MRQIKNIAGHNVLLTCNTFIKDFVINENDIESIEDVLCDDTFEENTVHTIDCILDDVEGKTIGLHEVEFQIVTISKLLAKFLDAFNKETDLVEKLLIIYDFVDICPDGKFRLHFCKHLMQHWITNEPKDDMVAINVFKTLEINCRGFRNNEITKNEYETVVHRYNTLIKPHKEAWKKKFE